jgi:hypothetical protein
MPKCRSALFALALIVTFGAFLVSKAHAQEAASSQELQVGIIVTRTSETAQDVLKELNAGMDFGVLAKEKSIDPTGGRWRVYRFEGSRGDAAGAARRVD